jgi:hypothetical protein
MKLKRLLVVLLALMVFMGSAVAWAGTDSYSESPRVSCVSSQDVHISFYVSSGKDFGLTIRTFTHTKYVSWHLSYNYTGWINYDSGYNSLYGIPLGNTKRTDVSGWNNQGSINIVDAWCGP